MKTLSPVHRPAAALCTLLFFLLFGFWAHAQSTELMVIDANYPNKDGLKASLPIDVKTIEVNASTDLWKALETEYAANQNIQNIHFFAETTNSSFTMGGKIYDAATLNNDEELRELKDLPGNINLLVYSCSLANNANGRAMLSAFGNQSGLNVVSCGSCQSLNDEAFTFDFSNKGQPVVNHLFD